MARTGPILFFVAFAVCFVGRVNSEYLGKFLGKLSELHHGVSGEVYAVDGRTLYIKDYTYDGQGPAAYFYASTHKTPDSRGFRLRDENNNGDVIRRYRKEGVTITLPEGKSLSNIKIFYVWCEEFDVNFGDVKIPRSFDFPRPQKVDALKGVHSISSDNIVIVDAQTLLIPNLHYDGEAPDAKFWVGRGPKPSPQGIRVSDENGKEVPLRKYDGKTVVLTLPGDLTVFDIGHFGIWCEQFTVDFGHIQIPQSLNVPPSLKMLGVSPQSKLNCEVLDDKLAFEVRWAVAGESIVLQLVAKLDSGEYMSFGLSGDVSKSVMIGGDVVVAWVDKETLKGYAQDYYLGDKSQCSGPTGSCPDSRLGDNTNNIRLLNAAMVNGYSIVTYQRPLKAADQYDLPIYTNQSQAILWAVGPLNQRDEVSFHSSYLKRDSFIDFARPAKWNCPLPEGETPARQVVPIQNRHQEDVTSEETVEPAVPSRTPEPEEDEEPAEPSTTAAPRRESGNRRRGGNRITTRQPVANTDLAEEGQASKREPTRTRGTTRITQSSTTQTVPPPTPVKERDAWYIPPIECYEPEDGVFYAQMGPTGGKRGYPAITGHVGWGISWYINGLLIPEINVVRGKTYNFITEGGDNPEVPAKYHPFYITDDPIGGYVYKTAEEKKNVTIFSGVTFDKNDEAQPTGTGRLCHWTQTGEREADDFDSFGAYQRTLQLKCDMGEPGVIQWTPDRDTPDTVYYQCFTHRYLGWKINVHDSCEQSAASEFQPSIVPAPKDLIQTSFSDQSDVELEASPSIRQETMVMPNHILINQIKAANQINQPTVSENPTTTLDQQHQQPSTTRTTFSHHPQTSFDQIQNTPSPLLHGTPIIGTSGLSVRQQQTLGQFVDYDKEATNFGTTPPRDLQLDYEVFPRKASFVVKRMTTTEQPTELNPHSKPISITNKKLVYFLPKQNPQLQHFQYTSPISSNNMQLPDDFSNHAVPLNSPKTITKGLYYVALNKQHQLLEYPQPINYNNKPFYRQAPQQKRVPIMYNIKPELKNPISQTTRAHTFFNTLPMTIALPIKTLSEASAQASALKQVEISPEQASTEREPSDIQTASPLTLLVHPSSSEDLNPIAYQTPDNRGFNPESVVIEGGFKPIISQKFEDRVDDDDDFEPEIEPEGEVGVIEVKGKKKFEGLLHPIMIPSPSDDGAKLSKIKLKKVIRKPLKKEIIKLIVRTRSLIDSDVEPEMAAAERGESYYLPPPGKTDKLKLAAAKMPSGIDFEVPALPSSSGSSGPSSTSSKVAGPDVVVTFDGRRVSGASLTAKPFEKPVAFERGSKATEFLKALPQSVPYKGDLPPLSANVLFNYKSNAPIGTRGAGVLNRDLDTPLPPPSTSSSSSGKTKLRRVRRAAHHTPEHTAQQMDEMSEAQRGNSTTPASGSETLMRVSLISLGFSVMAFVLLRRW